MQSLHQNALLLLMLVVTGVSVYVAIELRKRLNKADALMHSIDSVTKNAVTQKEVDALRALVETPPEPDPPASAATDPPIKIVQSRPRKRKADE